MTQTETNQAVLDAESPDTINEPLSRYVVVGIYQNKYGITTDSTVELIASSSAQITRVPHSPAFISGVINHRGSIIPVIDTRTLLGFQTCETEIDGLLQMLADRERDHVNWLNELRRCVQNAEEFTKGRDPNMCAFGKWYNKLRASQNEMEYLTKGDASLRGLIEYFDAPHKRIHAIADRVLELAEDGETEKALGIIQAAWNTDLASMRELFKKVGELIQKSHAPMMIITELGSRKAAMMVDAVYTVQDVPDRTVEVLPESADNPEFLKGLVHEPDGSYILITDLEHIYDAACPVDNAEDD